MNYTNVVPIGGLCYGCGKDINETPDYFRPEIKSSGKAIIIEPSEFPIHDKPRCRLRARERFCLALLRGLEDMFTESLREK